MPEKVEAHDYPKPTTAWYMVALLTIAYILSYMDRSILGLLVESVKNDLNLTDTQIGLLLGPAFAIFYATTGVPLGWLADRQRRTWIIGVGITLWSCATALSGLAKNFAFLFTARMAVGVGEATLSPCATTMIADSFPKDNRGKPVAVYSAALSVGAGLAGILGATIIAWSESIGVLEAGILGELTGWRLTFIIVGLPGLLLAPLFFFLREPSRVESGGIIDRDKSSVRNTISYLKKKKKMFGSFLSVFCLMTVLGYSQGWGAALFSRSWNWSATEFGMASGMIYLVLGPLTANISGLVNDRLYSKGHTDAPLLIPAVGAVIMTFGSIFMPMMPTPYLALVFFAIAAIGLTMATATGVLALMNVTPATIRGQVVAIYYMCISIAGLMLGPTTVGLLADYVFGAQRLDYAMASLPIIFGLPVCLMLPLTLRIYRKELQLLQS